MIINGSLRDLITLRGYVNQKYYKPVELTNPKGNTDECKDHVIFTQSGYSLDIVVLPRYTPSTVNTLTR